MMPSDGLCFRNLHDEFRQSGVDEDGMGNVPVHSS